MTAIVTILSDDYVWSAEKEEILLSRLREQLPEKDIKSFRVTLKKIDWEKVAFEEWSASECKEHFMTIISKLTALK